MRKLFLINDFMGMAYNGLADGVDTAYPRPSLGISRVTL